MAPRLLRHLRKAGEEVDAVVVESWREALAHVRGSEGRAAVVVHRAGEFDGIEAAGGLRSTAPEALVIVMGAPEGRQDLRAALRRGADAVVFSDRLETLGDIIRAMQRRRDLSVASVGRSGLADDPLAPRVSEGDHRAHALFDQSPAVMLVVQGGVIVRASAAAARLAGEPEGAAIVGRKAASVIGDEAWAALERATSERGADASRRRPFAQQWRAPDGRPVEMEVSAAPCVYDGRSAWQIVAMDISSLRAVSREARRWAARNRISSETLEGVLDGLPAQIAVLDIAGRILRTNAGWRRFGAANDADPERTGAEVNYLAECDRAAHAGNHDGKRAGALIREVLSGRSDRSEMEYACHAPDTQRWMNMLVSPVHSEGGAGCVVMHVNVTDRHRALTSLLETERHFRLSMDATGIGVVEVSLRDGNARWDARAAELLRGVGSPGAGPARELLGTLEEQARLDALSFIHEPREIDREWRVRPIGGEERWIAVRGAPSIDGDRATWFCWDVTAHRRATALQREHEQLQSALSAMEQVLGVVGHELRTPLAVIRANAELLATEGFDDTEGREKFLDAIQREVVRAGALVNDALEVSRMNSGVATWNWSSFRVADICEEVATRLRPLIDDERVTVRVAVEPPDLEMRGDADGIHRMVLNLASNAARHTKNGQVSIRARAERGGGRSWIVYEVMDTGEGIPARIALRLGEAFALNSGLIGPGFTGGAGLGLAICRSIAAAHGGAITFVSGLAQGTTFRAQLRADLIGPVTEGETPRIEGVTAS